MTQPFMIRSMQPGEETAVCALVARVFDDFVAPDFPPAGVAEFRRYVQPEALAQRCATGNEVLLELEEGRIVGMIELRGCDHIALLFVDPPGRGIGRRLLARALQICREAAPPSAQVTVHTSRYAVPAYRKLGFEAEGPERTENGITYLPMAFRFECGGEDR